MITKFYDGNGSELMAASVNGVLRLYLPNRLPYTGPVIFKTTCENNADPCVGGQSPNCQDCNCYGLDPIVMTIHNLYLADYRGSDGEYNHATLKQLMVEDRLQDGRCSAQKAFIICMDAMVIFEWHEQDQWIVDAVIELSKVQLT